MTKPNNTNVNINSNVTTIEMPNNTFINSIHINNTHKHTHTHTHTRTFQ